jgi:esterase/lipase
MNRIWNLTLRLFRNAFLVLIVFCLVIILVPINPELKVKPLTKFSFDQAINFWQNKQSQEIEVNSPTCSDRLFHHNQRTSKAIVLYHGLTNCPKQFEKLGEMLWQKGYTVLIPRIPYHGHKNRLNKEFSKLKYIDLTNKVSETMSLAISLADKVDTMGISAGSNLAIWTSLNYSIDKLIAIAPLVMPHNYPLAVSPLINRYLKYLPNQDKWWNEETKDKIIGTSHAYPFYSSKAILAFFEINQSSLDFVNSFKGTKKSTQNYLVLVENDTAIDNKSAKDFFGKIQIIFEKPIIQKTFESSLNLDHDIVDPTHEKARIEIVYPALIQLLI